MKKFRMISDSDMKEKLNNHEKWLSSGPGVGEILIFNKRDLTGQVFTGIDLSYAVFKSCNLAEAVFDRCILYKTAFHNCVLTGTSFDGANIHNAIFKPDNSNIAKNINPDYYKDHPSGVECIKITEHFNFCIGNAIKYLWRAGKKTDDTKEDLQKALWYIQREIDRQEK